MRSSTFILMACLEFSRAGAQSSGGFEQLYYMHPNEGASMVPMAHITRNNWYGEARYNYDETQTLSLYAGRTFARHGAFNWSATPVIGGLMGRMNGGSVGVNMDLGYEKIFFTTQSQYTFSMEQSSNRYFFSWSELGYQALPWLYGGMALQQLNVYQTPGRLEPGCMLGLSLKNFTVPVYVFNPSGGETYFVLGLNWAWDAAKKPATTNILAISSSDHPK